MPDVDVLAVLVAAIAGFVLGAAYYVLFGKRLAEVSDAAAGEQTPPWKLAVELVRCLIIAAVAAGLASQAEIDEWAGGLSLGLALWIGFPFVLWLGDGSRGRALEAAAIHAGDWLVKLAVVSVIVSVWQ